MAERAGTRFLEVAGTAHILEVPQAPELLAQATALVAAARLLT
jgi:hypothetical protein